VIPRVDALRCDTFRDAAGGVTSAFVPREPPGPGVPLFLAPALGLDGRSFAGLAPLARERRVVLWSPPNESARRGIEALGPEVVEHADRAGLPRRFVVGGSSLGAVRALAAAVAAPERVAGLVLMGGVARWRDLGPGMRLARLLHPVLPRRSYHRAFARVLAPGRAEPDSTTAFLRAQMERRTKGYIDGVLDALRRPHRFDLAPRLGEVRAPTLIVHSRGDHVAPFAAARRLATIPGARIVALEGRSHVPYIHDPETVIAAMRPFLAEIDALESA
jgi:pimeloyl-ACP methyl ester carboxylesterase